MVSSPHPVPCIEPSSFGKDRAAALSQGSLSSEEQSCRVPGSYVKGSACGGRHSAVITGMPLIIPLLNLLNCHVEILIN